MVTTTNGVASGVSAATLSEPRSLQYARQALELAFSGQSRPWSFRLWDGSLVHAGEGTAESIVYFKTREAFRTAVAKIDLVAFGEAYINGEIDFEGDLFDVMERASVLTFDHLPWAKRLKIWSLARKV